MALATFTVTNNGTYLVVTSTTGNVEMISLSEIKDITFLFLAASPGTYPYAGMNLMTVEVNGRSADLSFDLAAVTGQAGWTLDQAGCIQCQSDIISWTASGSYVVTTTDVESVIVRDTSSGKTYQQISSWDAGVATITYLDAGGSVVAAPGGVLQFVLSSILSDTTALVLDKDFELIIVNDVTNDVLVKQRTIYTAGVAVVSYENMDGTAYAGVGPVYEFLSGGDTSLLATEATLLTIAPVAQTLTSLSANVAGSVLAGQRAVSFFLDGPGGTLNGVVRPNGWSQTFEFDNDTTPEITYVGTATCTIYIDYLT